MISAWDIGKGLRDLPRGGSPYGSVLYHALLQDHFSGASLDTSKWSRTQSTTGFVEVEVPLGMCRMRGNGSWGSNGAFSASSWARAAGLVYEVSWLASANTSACIGWHDGAGVSFADIAHGFLLQDFNIFVFENSNNRGDVGDYADHTLYRARFTILGSNCKYEIQGGAFGTFGGSSWTNVTPGTSSSATDPLSAAFVIQDLDGMLLDDIRVYST